MIFAYTIKGYGLPTQGHPRNHSALLTSEQIRSSPASSEPIRTIRGAGSRLAARRASCVQPQPAAAAPQYPLHPVPSIPADFGRTPAGTATTQAALGPRAARPDQGGTAGREAGGDGQPGRQLITNLGGWINKVGVWSAADRTDWFADDRETALHWREKQTGQHIELGIAETNLAGLLGELGATWSRWGQPLLPIGVLYDPFVERALSPGRSASTRAVSPSLWARPPA